MNVGVDGRFVGKAVHDQVQDGQGEDKTDHYHFEYVIVGAEGDLAASDDAAHVETLTEGQEQPEDELTSGRHPSGSLGQQDEGKVEEEGHEEHRLRDEVCTLNQILTLDRVDQHRYAEGQFHDGEGDEQSVQRQLRQVHPRPPDEPLVAHGVRPQLEARQQPQKSAGNVDEHGLVKAGCEVRLIRVPR